MKRKSLLLTLVASLLPVHFLSAQNFITGKNEQGAFPLVTSSQTTSIYVDETDDWLVHKAAALLQSDIEMVTGKKPGIISTLPAPVKNIIIIGTINKSPVIDR